MRVSFVIPTRNQARFIRRTLDSCLAQRVADREVIVVDGASTDGTQDILASYGDRIRWTSEPDRGQTDAVNKGIASATGDVVAWINSDDYYPDERSLEIVQRTFLEGANVDIVYGRTMTVDEHGNATRPHRTLRIVSPKDVLLQPTGPAMQPSTFFRRSLFLEVGGLNPDLHFAMDYDLWLRMFPRARSIRFVERVLSCATFHADAKSIHGMLDQIGEVVAIKRARSRAFALGAGDRARMWLGIASLYAYWAAVRSGLRRVM